MQPSKGFFKVKGHRKKKEMKAGEISWHNWMGNDEADLLANRGARKAAQSAPNGDCDRQLKRAIKLYKWVRQFVNAWPQDTERAEEKDGVAGDRGAEEGEDSSKLPPRHRGWPHAWWIFREAIG